VKVFGTDLDVLNDLTGRVAEAVRRVPGASNVYPEQVTNGQYLNIVIDRAAAARYGIGVGAVSQVIETAIGEATLTTTIEGRRRFPVRVRYAPAHRADPAALGQVLVQAPSGAQIPLAQLARVEPARGPAMSPCQRATTSNGADAGRTSSVPANGCWSSCRRCWW
jgi:Cu(I)/Ag(I) efflux system membrane protein CusA/SilA